MCATRRHVSPVLSRVPVVWDGRQPRYEGAQGSMPNRPTIVGPLFMRSLPRSGYGLDAFALAYEPRLQSQRSSADAEKARGEAPTRSDRSRARHLSRDRVVGRRFAGANSPTAHQHLRRAFAHKVCPFARLEGSPRGQCYLAQNEKFQGSTFLTPENSLDT